MKKICIVVCLLIFGSGIYAQNETIGFDDVSASVPKIRVSIIVPGVSVEKGISEKITLFTEIGSGFGLSISQNDGTFWVSMMSASNGQDISGTHFKIFPFVKMEGRYYYNLGRRKALNKSIANFTGNYISSYNVYLLNQQFISGMTWGLQRNWRRFHFNLNLGLGLYFNSDETGISIINEAKIGFLLN
jgi:hypothetical protein